MKNEEVVKIVRDAMIKLHERRTNVQLSPEVMKIKGSSEVKVKARSPQSLNKSFRSSGKHLESIRE